MLQRRAQSWSIDVVIAVVIFGFIAIVFTSFALLDKGDVDELQENAQDVAIFLGRSTPGCGPVLLNESLDNTSLSCLFNSNYNTYKRQLRIDGDFCIYIEDEMGQIVQFNGRNGWGSSSLLVGGRPCGT